MLHLDNALVLRQCLLGLLVLPQGFLVGDRRQPHEAPPSMHVPNCLLLCQLNPAFLVVRVLPQVLNARLSVRYSILPRSPFKCPQFFLRVPITHVLNLLVSQFEFDKFKLVLCQRFRPQQSYEAVVILLTRLRRILVHECVRLIYDRAKMPISLVESVPCIFGCLALEFALLRPGNGFFAGPESVECKIEVVAYDLSSFPGITSQYLCRDLNRVTGCVASVAVAPTGILKEFQ